MTDHSYDIEFCSICNRGFLSVGTLSACRHCTDSISTAVRDAELFRKLYQSLCWFLIEKGYVIELQEDGTPKVTGGTAEATLEKVDRQLAKLSSMPSTLAKAMDVAHRAIVNGLR